MGQQPIPAAVHRQVPAQPPQSAQLTASLPALTRLHFLCPMIGLPSFSGGYKKEA